MSDHLTPEQREAIRLIHQIIGAAGDIGAAVISGRVADTGQQQALREYKDELMTMFRTMEQERDAARAERDAYLNLLIGSEHSYAAAWLGFDKGTEVFANACEAYQAIRAAAGLPPTPATTQPAPSTSGD